jgi:hypothetical protein
MSTETESVTFRYRSDGNTRLGTPSSRKFIYYHFLLRFRVKNALQEGTATIQQKPDKVILTKRRPRMHLTKHRSNNANEDPEAHSAHAPAIPDPRTHQLMPPAMFGQPGPMYHQLPYYFPSAYSGYQIGQPPAPFQRGGTHLHVNHAHMMQAHAMPPFAQPPAPHFGGNTGVDFPTIAEYLAYLDSSPSLQRTSIKYGLYASNFSAQMFEDFKQLLIDPNFITPTDLAKLVDVPLAIMLSLLQHAKDDAAAICSGQLTIPPLTTNSGATEEGEHAPPS